MSPPGEKPELRDHEFREMKRSDKAPSHHLEMDDLKEVKMRLSADLGKCPMLVREILELKRGSVVRLDKIAGEMTDIYISDLLLARGEVVVIGDALHIRLAEIVGAEERTDDDVPSR